MTDKILEKAQDNRYKYVEYEDLFNIVQESAGNNIRIVCQTGSFNLPPQLNDSFIKLMNNFLEDEMIRLDKEFKEL